MYFTSQLHLHAAAFFCSCGLSLRLHRHSRCHTPCAKIVSVSVLCSRYFSSKADAFFKRSRRFVSFVDFSAGGSWRPGELRGSGSPPYSAFLSVSEYYFCFPDWLDAQCLSAIPNVSYFRGRSSPSDVNLETPVSAWQICCRGFIARGGDTIPTERGLSFTDIQLCRSSCALGSRRRLGAPLPALESASAALSSWLSSIAVPDQCVELNMLQNPFS